MSQANASRTVTVIGVPMDLGAGRRGVDMGPSAIRIAGLHEKLRLLGLSVDETGDLSVRIPESLSQGEKKQIYLEEIAGVCGQLSSQVRSVLERRALPLVLGGDHSLATGSVAGTVSHFRDSQKKVGLLWIDAHTDMNTPETSPSGNVHGMPLAAILGMGPEELSQLEGFAPKIDPNNVVVIGTRSVDQSERENIRRSRLRVVTMKEIDKRGLRSVMEEALEIVNRGTAGFHCSFDLDVVDPQSAPGVGTPVPGGMTYRESHLAMELVHDSRSLLSLEFVEVNPVLDQSNMTGTLAVELATSALGKKIL